MPKERQNRKVLFQKWFDSDPDFYADISICINSDNLYCKICERLIYSTNKIDVTRHIRGHTNSSKRANESIFQYELAEAFISSNIPLHKLANPILHKFLERYTSRKIPDESTLRKTYIPKIYNKVIKQIREELADKFIYFIIDETTDACGLSIVNFMVGTLNSGTSSVSHLLASRVLEKTSHTAVVNFVEECLKFLWLETDSDNKENVLLMITEATSYMEKAGTILKQHYKNLIHFTCVVQALHIIIETVEDNFPLVNELISNVKKIFINAPARRKVFKDALPEILLPPEPVITRCETWLEAVIYYHTNFKDIQSVISLFDAGDNSAIQQAQKLMDDDQLLENLNFIKDNYSVLISAIKQLETHGLSLNEQFTIINNVTSVLGSIDECDISNKIKEKLKILFQQNPGYNILETINEFLNGRIKELPQSISKYHACIANFAYCPLSLVDVERPFSLHKLILSDRRRIFSTQKLEKHIVINFELNNHTKDAINTSCEMCEL